MKLYLDGESVGLGGYAKTFQYAIDDGPVEIIVLFKGWESDPIVCEKLEGLHKLLNDPSTIMTGYNTAFDFFLLYKTLHRMKGFKYDSAERPVEPFKCKTLDLYVAAASRSPLAPFSYSKGASKSVAAVRKIPRRTADVVAARVEGVLRPLLPEVVELKRHEKEVKGSKDLVTLCWTLDGRMSLKNLMQVYGLKTLKLAELWPLPAKGTESPWLPYPDPAVHDPIEAQCDTVMSDPDSPFWKYAELDIWFLKVLEEKLGYPEPNQHDTCTHIVAYTRYYGFPLDREVLLRTKAAYQKKIAAAQDTLQGINLGSPKQKLALLRQHDPLIASSAKKVIQVIADSDRPAAPIAQAMMDYTSYTQRLNQVEKVLGCRTGRAHPSLRVMGTRTGRMAGEAGLNWQGIPQAKKGIGIRAALGAVGVGDWSQFEVCIAAAAYPDVMIQSDLDNNVDAHTMNAILMQPEAKSRGWTYEAMVELIEAKDPLANSLRKRTKPVTFGLQYFCQAQKVAEVLGVPLSVGEAALAAYYARYQGFGAYKTRIEKETCTADTENWTRGSVQKMAREVTDMTGYTMRWDFEAKCAEALWQLGGTGIQTGIDGTVVRSVEKGRQSLDGAVKSALLGGAISIQAAVSRQRGNALVQATGANLTKMLMNELWQALRCPMMNIHDEIVFADHPNFDLDKVQTIIASFTERWKKRIPSLFFDFHPTKVWADK